MNTTEHTEQQDTLGVSLIIPFFNEGEGIAHLASRLIPVVRKMQKVWNVQIILIDDGSSDDTYAQLRKHFGRLDIEGLSILRHIENSGIGAAMVTGFEAATGDIVCTMDSDCTYAPEDIPKLVHLIVDEKADIATGSPYHPEGQIDGVAAWRIAVSKSASWLYRRVVPEKLYCYTSMFRAYRREWARPEHFESEGFLSVAELILAGAYRGARIVELPSRLEVRAFGDSKLRFLSVVRSHLGLLARATLVNLSLGWMRVNGMSFARDFEKTPPVFNQQPSGELLNRMVLVGRVRGVV